MNEMETALYQKLTGDAALIALLASGANSVFNQRAAGGAAYPLVIFQQQGGGDENKSPHRSQNFLYLVKAISSTSLQEAGTIDAAIDAALHLKTLTVAGWTNFWLARENEVRFTETTPEGVNYYHAGAVYRVRIAK